MLQLNDRVYHNGHQFGTVIEVRESKSLVTLHQVLTQANSLNDLLLDQFGSRLLQGVYSPQKYPYKVRFDTGYTDVYSERDLELVT